MDIVQNVLIVEDEQLNIDTLDTIFEKIKEKTSINIFFSKTGEKALNIVKLKNIDLILLDIGLPNMDGFEVCRKLKANPRTKDIPILFLTAHNDNASIVKAYNLGAVDYITKPFKAVELIARVKLNLVLQMKIKNLEHAAYYDYLTNVYNRRKFFELAEKKFLYEKQNLYGVMIDIDQFKTINDTYGHAIGDIVLNKVATIIKEKVNDSDVLGRVGGEEFAIVCNSKSQDALLSTLEDLRQQVEDFEIINEDGKVIKCTISIGFAAYHENMEKIDHLLHIADEALYEAKEQGRNRSIFRVSREEKV